MKDSAPTRLVDDPAVPDAIREHLRAAIDAPVAPVLPLDTGTADLAQRISTHGGSWLTKVIVGVMGAAGVGAAVMLATSGSDPEPPPARAVPSVSAPTEAEVQVSTELEPGPEPEVAPATEEPSVQPELPAPEVEATRRRAARTGGAATKPIDDETKAARTRDEVRILRQARRAVSTDPARAWALVRQLESEYADGLMVEEREAVAIEVLAALGRDDEARQRGQTFLQRYPASPSADRVRQVIRKRAPTP